MKFFKLKSAVALTAMSLVSAAGFTQVVKVDGSSTVYPVTEAVAATQGSWTAWDAYRRFVQSWGMGHGLDRDRFDRLIADAKRRGGVPRSFSSPMSGARL